MDTVQTLKNSAWLAERLGVSLTTIERMRVHQPEQLPPHITIGKSIRYDIVVVEQWLKEHRTRPTRNTITPQEACHD